MTIQKLKKELYTMLKNNNIDVNMVQLRKYNKETGEIDKCIISVGDINTSEILYRIKETINEFENTYNVCIVNKYLEI